MKIDIFIIILNNIFKFVDLKPLMFLFLELYFRIYRLLFKNTDFKILQIVDL